jgi:hypothetical protein
VISVSVVANVTHRRVVEQMRRLEASVGTWSDLSVDFVTLPPGVGRVGLFIEVLQKPVDVLLIDGHGYFDVREQWMLGVPLMTDEAKNLRIRARAVALGVCHGGTKAAQDWLRMRLSGPTCVLACRKAATYAAGAALWPELFRHLNNAAGQRAAVATANFGTSFRQAKNSAKSEHPNVDWRRWQVKTLEPAVRA